MRTNPAVQFHGVQKVLDAYEKRQAPSFMLTCGNQLLLKHQGADMEEGKQVLYAYLKEIRTPENIATYTLAVFDEIPKGGISVKTAYDGSFNFKIHESGYQTPWAEQSGSRYDELKEMIVEMRAEMNARESETDKPGGIMGMISGILENPQAQQMIMQRLIGVFDKLFTMEPQAQLGRVAGAEYDSNYDVQVTAMNESWHVLYQSDSKIGEHLRKLAALSQAKPEQFKGLITMLENLSV